MIAAVIIIVGLIFTMGVITIKAASDVKDLQIENDYLKEIIEQNEVQIGMLEAQLLQVRTERRVIDAQLTEYVEKKGVSGVSRYN